MDQSYNHEIQQLMFKARSLFETKNLKICLHANTAEFRSIKKQILILRIILLQCLFKG